MEFHKHVCLFSSFGDECFIARSETGFAHCLVLKDGAVPALKDPRS